MRLRRIVAELTACGLLVTACSAGSAARVEQGVYASGTALDALGNTFVSTTQAMAELCKAGRVAPATCQGYGTFVRTFKPSYEAAVKAWSSASDAKSAQQAAESLLTLSNQLTAYAVQAAQQAAGGK